MREPNNYRPVYHFVDERLFKAFVEKIPRSNLVDPLRGDQELRNRYFPGFRISETTPTQQQVITAYRRDILQRSNTGLANDLCAHWIRSSHELAGVALQSVGLTSEHAAEVETWIKEVQSNLEEKGLEFLRTLVQALCKNFSAEDILIFVSIIGYCRDQQPLRDFVEQELRRQVVPDGNSDVEMERIEQQLHLARATLTDLKRSREELERDLVREANDAQEARDNAAREHGDAELKLSEIQAKSGALAKDLEELRKRQIDHERALKEQTRHSNKLLKTLAHHEKQRALIITSQEIRRKEADRRGQEQAELIESLGVELQNRAEEARAEAARTEAALAEAGRAEVARAEEACAQQSRTQTVRRIAQPTLSESNKRTNERVGNNAICYQGLQRSFRNSLVGFLRDRLPRLFPTDHTQRIKKLFGEHWEKAAQNAAQSREIGGTNTTIRDEYDLLGTNHFFEIFDKFYDKLFTIEAGQAVGRPKPVKSKFLGNLKTIKDGRDPLSHPVEEEVSFEEAHHLLIEAKQILTWLGYETEAEYLSVLASQLDGSQVESPSIVRRLPSEDSIYQEFVGRGTILTDLATCFAKPDSRRCLLAGDGGKGKSAVAYRFAQNLSRTPGRFQLIVWLSAKRRKFQDGAISHIELPDFTSAEEAIDRLLQEYGATASDLSKSLEDKRRILIEYLDALPAFIIADDIDTVLDDYQVVSLFTHEIPHTQSAVLLTSRLDIPGIRSFVIKEFDVVEAGEFVRSRINLYDLDATLFSDSVVAEITKATDGSPLYMDDLLRLTRIVHVKSAIKMWNEKKGDEARKYALQRELERLSTDAKKVLIAAAITDDPISFAELENILALPEDRLYLTLNELQTLFLFPKPRIVEGEQRFQINLNTKKLVRLVESSSDLFARVERASKALAGTLPDAGHGVISSLIRQAHLRVNSGKYGEAEAILQDAIGKYPNATDLRGFLGYAYKREGRIADARIQFDAASKLKGSKREMFGHWIKMEISIKEWSKAITVADRALKVHPNFYEMRERKVYAQRQAGFDLHSGLHREKAEKMWSDAVEEVKRGIKAPEELESGARQQSACMLCSIVICLDMLGRFRERDQWLERWEKEHPDDPQVARQKQILRNKRGTMYLGAS